MEKPLCFNGWFGEKTHYFWKHPYEDVEFVDALGPPVFSKLHDLKWPCSELLSLVIPKKMVVVEILGKILPKRSTIFKMNTLQGMDTYPHLGKLGKSSTQNAIFGKIC